LASVGQNIPQYNSCSAVTHLKCGTIFNDRFTAEFTDEAILKIKQHLAQLQARTQLLGVFLHHSA